MNIAKLVSIYLFSTALVGAMHLDAQPFFATSANLHAVIFSDKESLDWAKECLKIYPEIGWLANKDVHSTNEGQAKGLAYSEILFGKKYIEFDRTLMGLRCFRLIFDGSEKAYQELTKGQAAEKKLSKATFLQIHRFVVTVVFSRCEDLPPLEIAKLIEAGLVLGDIGKSPKARAIFEKYGANAPDHDDFYEEVMQILAKQPELCPTFAALNKKSQRILISIANLAHYGHITHLEGGKEMFQKLYESQVVHKNHSAFLIDFLIHLFDVAGAAGHVSNEGSLVLTEDTAYAMVTVLRSCDILSIKEHGIEKAYKKYVELRASRLGLDKNNPTDCVLTRFASMLRLFDQEDAWVLQTAFASLPDTQKLTIFKEFGPTSSFKRTPTYVPAVLVNLMNNKALGKDRQTRLMQAVTLGLPFIAKVFESHRNALREGLADEDIPLCFNFVAGLAKTQPELLESFEQFFVDEAGNVQLK